MEKAKKKSEPTENQKQEPSTLNQVLKFSGLGLQMLVTIGVFIAIGFFLDKWFNNSKPLWILILSFVGTAAGFYQFYKSLPKL
ncbi:AtpZ/AtpI family protein [Peijinzhouia sedimentorum]